MNDAELDRAYQAESDAIFRRKWEGDGASCDNCYWSCGCECDLHPNRPEFGVCDDYLREGS